MDDRGQSQDTYCAHCGALLIETRSGVICSNVCSSARVLPCNNASVLRRAWFDRWVNSLPAAIAIPTLDNGIQYYRIENLDGVFELIRSLRAKPGRSLRGLIVARSNNMASLFRAAELPIKIHDHCKADWTSQLMHRTHYDSEKYKKRMW